MVRYLIRRLLWAATLFVVVTMVTYVIFFIIPADPARLACGQRATPGCIQRAAEHFGLDRPVYAILPWATFAILFAALYVRLIRAAVMEVTQEDYVRTARAKGAPERIVVTRSSSSGPSASSPRT